ncbi:Protein-arginine kinase [Labeo rohita]|uniref:Protein-arginine kinase n=1 Tax=Labeo rohita TaxID=84645 RepID=A0ABQ8LKK2_LABRO|nr:Protein-arginine kinase [Labeo rohita]
MLGLMAPASLVLQLGPVLRLGLLRMRPLQYWLKPWVPSHAWRHRRLRIRVDQTCVKALIPWKDSQCMQRGVSQALLCRRKMVTTDASNTGWGALGHFTHRRFRESGRSLARQRSTSSPQKTTLIAQFTIEGQGRVGPQLAQSPPFRFSLTSLTPQVIRRVREQKHIGSRSCGSRL